MPRPDTLQFNATLNAWILADYPETFDVSTIPDYQGTSAALLLSAHNARWSLMTRVAGLIDEHHRRQEAARNYEEYPDTDEGSARWFSWVDEPLESLSEHDIHLVEHGAIGLTAAKIWGGDDAEVKLKVAEMNLMIEELTRHRQTFVDMVDSHRNFIAKSERILRQMDAVIQSVQGATPQERLLEWLHDAKVALLEQREMPDRELGRRLFKEYDEWAGSR